MATQDDIRRIVRDVLLESSVDDHLRERGLDTSRTRVVVDEEAGLATFLLYNLSGQIVGFQQYNPRGDKTRGGDRELVRRAEALGVSPSALMRYFTRVFSEGDEKKLAVWGLETLGDERHLFLTEGVFDASKLHNAGQPAIAVLSNDPQPLRSWLRSLGRLTIAVLDNDAAGSKLSRVADESVRTPDPWKDLGEMPQDAVDEFVSSTLREM